MFKMARDPFDICIWSRNCYLRIKGFPFKWNLCQVFVFFTMSRIIAQYNGNGYFLNDLLT